MRVRSAPATLSLVAAALVPSACADRNPVAPAAPGAAPRLASAQSGLIRVTQPVDVLLPANRCGLTSDVRLVGELTLVIKAGETGTGRTIGHVSSSAHGTGTGSDGSRYRFSYTQNVRLRDFVGAPAPDNPPYTAYLVDRFRLSGLAGAPDILTHWHFGVRLDAQGNATVLYDRQRNQECDPI